MRSRRRLGGRRQRTVEAASARSSSDAAERSRGERAERPDGGSAQPRSAEHAARALGATRAERVRAEPTGAPMRRRRSRAGSRGRAARRGRWSRRCVPPRRSGARPGGGAGAGRSRRGSRFSLRALQGRHDATTFSQVCSPPVTAGSRGRCSRPAGCSTGSAARHGRRRPGGTAGPGSGTGTRTKWASRITVGHGTSQPLGVELGVVTGDDLGLLLQDQHHRPPNRHDAQRLEPGVEHQGPAQAAHLLRGRHGWRASGSLPIVVAAPAQVHDDVGRVRGAAGPYWVSSRNRR